METRAFPFGYSGITVGTVKEMINQVNGFQHHPLIRERVIDLVRGLPSMDYTAEIRAVWKWVLSSMRYLAERGEHVTGPLELEVRTWYNRALEDCESIITYAVTLLAGAGAESVFELQGYGADPKDFSHVAARVFDRSSEKWVSFDPVAAMFYGEAFGLGDTLADSTTHVELWTLEGKKVGDMSMMGYALGDVSAVNIADAILGTVGQVAPMFGPAGKIVGGVANTVDGIVDIATGQPLVAIPIARRAPPPQQSSGALPIAVGAAALLGLLAL